MTPDYETQLANESMYELDRIQGGLAPLGTGGANGGQSMQVALLGSGAGKGLRELLGGALRMGKTKTDDILDKVEAEKGKNLLTPEALNDLEITLTGETQSAQELDGILPMESLQIGSVKQEAPFGQHTPIEPEDMLKAKQDATVPQDKRSEQRSYNIDRHHEGARAAINRTFDEMKSADDFAKVIDFIAESTEKRSSRSFDEIRQSVSTSKDIFSQLGPVLKGEQKGLLTDKQGYAMRVLASSLFRLVEKNARAISNGDDSSEMILSQEQTLNQLNFIIQYVMNNASETGRALSVHRMIAQSMELGSIEDMSKIIEQTGGVESAKYKAKLITQLIDQQGNTEGTATFLSALNRMRMKGASAATEYWRAQILTGFVTHAVNMVGTVMQNTWDNTVIRSTAAVIGETRKAFGGDKVSDYVSADEVGIANVMSFMTLRDSGKMFLKALKENQGRFSGNKVDPNTVGDFEDIMRFMFGQTSTGNKAAKGINNVALASYRVLGAEDEMAKAMAYRQELAGLSLRQAKREGLTGKEKWQRAEELQNAPTDELHADAMEFAKRTTFQDEIHGPVLSPFVSAVKNAIRHVPELGFIIPFVDTPTNVTRHMFEMAPVINTLTPTLRKQWMAGGAQRDIANAKVLWGIGLAYATYQVYDAGLFTGSGPKQWEVKKLLEREGWQANALQIGDNTYAIDRLSPHAQNMMLIGTLFDQAKYAGTEIEFMEAMSAASLIMADNVTKLPFLQGINTILDASKGRGNTVKKTLANIGAGFVPYSSMLKDVKKFDDPLTYAVSQDTANQSDIGDAVLQTIKTRLPLSSFNMRPKRYWDGELVLPLAGQFVHTMSPIKVGTKKSEHDPINMQLIDNQYVPPTPNPLVSFGGVEFSLVELDGGTGRIYDEYIKRVGAERRTVLGKVINQAGYKQAKGTGPQSQKAALLRQGNAKATEKAFRDFIEKDLVSLLKEAKSLSPIGQELLESGGVKSWAKEIRESFNKRKEKSEEFEKSVRLKGKSRMLAPDDVNLNPLK